MDQTYRKPGMTSVSPFPSHQVDSQSRWSCSSVFSYLQLQLLLERPYLTYSMAVALLNMGYFVPYFHLVAHSRQAGFSEYEAAFVMSAAGFTDIFGRVASGWFADLGHFRLVHLMSLWTTLAGVFIILLPVSSLSGSYAALVLTSLLYGFCSGALTSVTFAVVPLIVGVDRMMEALALLQLIESGTGLLGTPLSGRSTVKIFLMMCAVIRGQRLFLCSTINQHAVGFYLLLVDGHGPPVLLVQHLDALFFLACAAF